MKIIKNGRRVSSMDRRSFIKTTGLIGEMTASIEKMMAQGLKQAI
jgi:hypothetical protein